MKQCKTCGGTCSFMHEECEYCRKTKQLTNRRDALRRLDNEY